MIGALLRSATATPPVNPDAPTARAWLQQELAKYEYQQAKPSLFQQLGQWLQNWLSSLQAPTLGAGPPIWVLLLVLLVAALIGVGFLVYGLPRRNRRVRTAGLFGDDDDRGAAELRAAAERAAGEGDWPLAVVEQFRAIVRELGDRAVLSLAPGTTAHDAASLAGAVFPPEREALRAAARDFDGVRYLGEPGAREQWEAVRALDERIHGSRPELDAAALEGFVPVGGGR